jgi:hypothetical protein
MKAKFFLTLLALTGLFLGSNSAFAATGSTTVNTNADTLSQTISKLIDLDSDAHSLVSIAIDRALLAKGDRDSDSVEPEAVEDTSIQLGRKPIINGKVANPHPRPIINGKIANPNPRPIINGIIIKDRPQTQPTEDGKHLINGIIVNPDRR